MNVAQFIILLCTIVAVVFVSISLGLLWVIEKILGFINKKYMYGKFVVLPKNIHKIEERLKKQFLGKGVTKRTKYMAGDIYGTKNYYERTEYHCTNIGLNKSGNKIILSGSYVLDGEVITSDHIAVISVDDIIIFRYFGTTIIRKTFNKLPIECKLRKRG